LLCWDIVESVPNHHRIPQRKTVAVQLVRRLSFYDGLPLGAKAQSVYAWDEARRFSGFSQNTCCTHAFNLI